MAVCTHKLNEIVRRVEEGYVRRCCNLTLKEAYEVLGELCEPHDLLCQCYYCGLFLAVGNELVKRKLKEK